MRCCFELLKLPRVGLSGARQKKVESSNSAVCCLDFVPQLGPRTRDHHASHLDCSHFWQEVKAILRLNILFWAKKVTPTLTSKSLAVSAKAESAHTRQCHTQTHTRAPARFLSFSCGSDLTLVLLLIPGSYLYPLSSIIFAPSLSTFCSLHNPFIPANRELDSTPHLA